MHQKSKQIIGISGNALVGKDTLCNSMIKVFKEKYKLNANRISLAGDTVRLDMQKFIWDKFQIDVWNPTMEEKTLIRPLLVEYGRVQRELTKGRYFIDKFKPIGDISIAPDVRYAENKKDELYWITEEVDGFLIFLERDGNFPANSYEEVNNQKIKEKANLILNIPTFKKSEIESETLKYAEFAVNFYVRREKSITNDQLGTFQPSSRFLETCSTHI